MMDELEAQKRLKAIVYVPERNSGDLFADTIPDTISLQYDLDGTLSSIVLNNSSYMAQVREISGGEFCLDLNGISVLKFTVDASKRLLSATSYIYADTISYKFKYRSDNSLDSVISNFACSEYDNFGYGPYSYYNGMLAGFEYEGNTVEYLNTFMTDSPYGPPVRKFDTVRAVYTNIDAGAAHSGVQFPGPTSVYGCYEDSGWFISGLGHVLEMFGFKIYEHNKLLQSVNDWVFYDYEFGPDGSLVRQWREYAPESIGEESAYTAFIYEDIIQ